MAEAPNSSPFNSATQVGRQLKDLWGRQPKGRRLLATMILLGVVGWVAFTSFVKHVETWQPAIDGISPDDSNELYSALTSRGIAARLKDGKVEVHEEDLDQARAIASSNGVPSAGKGYEIFDGNNLGQSSFTEQVNYRRALQGELARSIKQLAQVEGARVQIAIGKRSVFKEQEVAPTASVALRLHAGQKLQADQVRGVRQLVAASVEGLKPEAVVIVDGHGNLLDSADPAMANHQLEIEHSIADRVRMILERVVGAGHVSVVANADVDLRKVSETEDLYDKDSAAVRSETKTVEGTDPTASVGGIAGARGNLPGAPAPAAGSGAAANGKVAETKNYEISHKVRQTTNPDVTLKKLHVAVLVDEQKGADGKPVVRTKAQLDELVALARNAAGIDDTRGDVIEVRSMQFAPEEDIVTGPATAASALPPVPVMIGGGAGALVLLVVAGLLLLKRGKKSKAGAQKQRALVGEIAFPTPISELERALEVRAALASQLQELPGLPSGARSTQDRVMDVVRADVDRAASVLTAWLAEPAPKGVKS